MQYSTRLGPMQEAWVSALPNYEKVTGTLVRTDWSADENGEQVPSIEGYCCLGVLVDIQTDYNWTHKPTFMSLFYDGILSYGSTLSPDLANKLGLNSVYGGFSYLGDVFDVFVKDQSYTSLTQLNDEGPFTNHTEMAEFIRDYARLIFKEEK